MNLIFFSCRRNECILDKWSPTNLFDTRDWFRGKIFFPGPGGYDGERWGDGFKCVTFVMHLFLLLLYQLHLRSSDIRSQRLGIPVLDSLEVKWSESHSVVSDSLWPHGLYSPWNSPGQDTGVGSLSFSRGSSQPRDWIQVSHIAGGIFTS